MASFFIPKRINVGFQERQGTYTGKLAYIIYFDEKGKLRKETSWNGWRDKKIDNEIFDNEPTSGFVLNKKAGGYSTGWNHRQTYVRVYDPRGFEFEIDITNLLYILENATSTKGKGLEGEFVYGWSGKDLVLIPCESPDYVELVKLNELRHSEKKIGARDLKLGATYRTRENNEWIYLGKFDEYDSWNGSKKKTKSFFFARRSGENIYFETIKSPTQKLVEVITEEPVADFADIFDEMERQRIYSPLDTSKDEYIPLTFEEFVEKFEEKRRWVYIWTNFDSDGFERSEISENYYRNTEEQGKYVYYKREEVEYKRGYYSWNQTVEKRVEKVRQYSNSLEEIFNIVKPHRKLQYLANGKFYGECTY
jgi:hypothetical protein